MTDGVPTPARLKWPIDFAKKEGTPPRPGNPVELDLGIASRADRHGAGHLTGIIGIIARKPNGQGPERQCS